MATKKRKARVDVRFGLMDLLLRAKNRQLVANSYLAKQQHWSMGGLSNARQALCQAGVLLCTDGQNAQDKTVALPSEIQTHEDWMLSFYNGKVPKRYQHYIEAQPIKKEVTSVTAIAVATADPYAGLVDQIKSLIDENKRLKKENRELRTANEQLEGGIVIIKECQERLNALQDILKSSRK